MPVIFSDKDKERIRETLFKTGFERIKKYGCKKVLTRIFHKRSKNG